MSLIRKDRRGPIEIWTLNRAERLNALPDLGDGDAFAAACEAVNADQSVRCVVLTGAGRAFSAGGDLKAMQGKSDLFEGTGAEIRERYRRVVHRIVRSLYGLEVPLIAAVNGPAMGLGCDIAGLADLRIASDAASFGVPVPVGALAHQLPPKPIEITDVAQRDIVRGQQAVPVEVDLQAVQRRLVPVEQDKLGRGEPGDLPAQLRADRAAGAGDQDDALAQRGGNS